MGKARVYVYVTKFIVLQILVLQLPRVVPLLDYRLLCNRIDNCPRTNHKHEPWIYRARHNHLSNFRYTYSAHQVPGRGSEQKKNTTE